MTEKEKSIYVLDTWAQDKEVNLYIMYESTEGNNTTVICPINCKE
jgi:hypothetical protein